MSTPSIAIAGAANDVQVARVAEALRLRDIEPKLLELTAFPADLPLTWDGSALCSGTIPIERPAAVYVRGLGTHPLGPVFSEELEARPRGLVAQLEEKRSFVESLLLTWQCAGTHLVNPLEANAQHRRKPFQLALLASAQLPIPQWFATNDPGALRRQLAHMDPSQWVYKPLAGGATVNALTPDDLEPERLDALAYAPVLFQRRIEGVSVRAFVCHGTVAAAAAITSSEIDYRRDEGEVTATALTDAEWLACTRAAEVCGMPFTGVDFIRQGNGRFFLLECNPSPMFAVFEEKTGHDVAGPLAEVLMQLAQSV